jgi:protein-tyrosine phosphatase
MPGRPPRSGPLTAALALLAAAALACERGVPPETRVIPSALPEASREASRRLPLDGAHNARDLGGYAGVDGRRVRWGRLYRSDALGELSDDDVSYLARLGVQQVVDFRSDLEREREPDRLPASPAPRVVLRPIFGEALDPQTLRDRILSGDARSGEMAEMLVAGNRAFVTEFAPGYSGFLRDLAEPENLPALFHCTAGKDRAGFASAVTLRTLGVPEETVYEDFLLTNHYTAQKIESTLCTIRLVSLFRVDPEQVRPVLRVERGYLAAAFDEIAKQYGSFDAYRRDALGMDDAESAAFRQLALE